MSVQSITCPRCGATSFNPNDIAQGYCHRCHWWTSDPTDTLNQPWVIAQAEREGVLGPVDPDPPLPEERTAGPEWLDTITGTGRRLTGVRDGLVAPMPKRRARPRYFLAKATAVGALAAGITGGLVHGWWELLALPAGYAAMLAYGAYVDWRAR